MGLLDTPRTRPRTYVEGTELDPNDMNETFDALIADGARLDQDLEFNFGPGSFLLESPGNATFVSGFEHWEATAGCAVRATLPFPTGAIIKGLRWVIDRNGTGTVTLQCKKSELGVGGASSDVIADVGVPAGAGVSTHNPAINYTIEADHQVIARCVFSAATQRLYGVRLTVRMP